ncbi:MAG: hypothetical protein BAJALOKI3v1_30135 [Promethearchaeota archaeon]|nr:MAG: hypothetical protein BAJALOKI3v1_30135 [Candidatus Lokiarchaeota archaeon]
MIDERIDSIGLFSIFHYVIITLDWIKKVYLLEFVIFTHIYSCPKGHGFL